VTSVRSCSMFESILMVLFLKSRRPSRMALGLWETQIRQTINIASNMHLWQRQYIPSGIANSKLQAVGRRDAASHWHRNCKCWWHIYNVLWPFRPEPSSGLAVLMKLCTGGMCAVPSELTCTCGVRPVGDCTCTEPYLQPYRILRTLNCG
jgi:hypothetical protein